MWLGYYTPIGYSELLNHACIVIKTFMIFRFFKYGVDIWKKNDHQEIDLRSFKLLPLSFVSFWLIFITG